MNKIMFYVISFLLMFLIIDKSEQHGYLYDPPARSSAWTGLITQNLLII
jgi:hypothetical protein